MIFRFGMDVNNGLYNGIQVWCGLCALEQCPVFRGLSSLVARDSESWREYSSLSIFLPIPTPFPSRLSLFHCMMVWKALAPDRVSGQLKILYMELHVLKPSSARERLCCTLLMRVKSSKQLSRAYTFFLLALRI